MRRRFLTCLLLGMLMPGVTACGNGTGPPASATDANNTLSDPRSLALPASQDGRFSVDPPPSLRPDQMKPPGPFDNVKPLEIKPGGSLGALGLNLKPLLTDGVTSTDERINRLESALVAMQADLKTLAPSMQRMALIENDMNALVGQLEALLQEEGMASPPPPAAVPPVSQAMPQQLIPEADIEPEIAEASPPPPAAAPKATAPPPAPAKAAPVPSGVPVLQGIRLGEHSAKTRVVIDVSGKVTYREDIDNMEKLLVVEMPEAALDGVRSGTFSSPLVKSWSAQPLESGKGVRIILVLTRDAAIVYDHLLTPSPDNANHRLVIDLKPGSGGV